MNTKYAANQSLWEESSHFSCESGGWRLKYGDNMVLLLKQRNTQYGIFLDGLSATWPSSLQPELHVYSQGSSAATSVPTDWDSAIFGYWDGWLDVLIEHRCVFVFAFGPHWEEKGEKLNHMDWADNEETV